MRVLDGELVQIEFVLHGGKLPGPGILEGDPDEALRSVHVNADVLGLDVAEFLPVLIGGTVDQHEILSRVPAANDKTGGLSRIG
jgi:hypothetical protein